MFMHLHVCGHTWLHMKARGWCYMASLLRLHFYIKWVSISNWWPCTLIKLVQIANLLWSSLSVPLNTWDNGITCRWPCLPRSYVCAGYPNSGLHISQQVGYPLSNLASLLLHLKQIWHLISSCQIRSGLAKPIIELMSKMMSKLTGISKPRHIKDKDIYNCVIAAPSFRKMSSK